ncbi:MAG: metallophosphoesterase [Treponema sp.]|nr:metallophosphoesterase [Treponema sp.]
MKIAVVSDIHQSIYWRQLIEQVNDFDKIIFLGDEFDCWRNKWPLQMNNAENIITFKKNYPEKIDLCWSNHAASYFLDERCSGYQYERAIDINEFYIKYKDLYNVIYIYGNWIFSHGGVSAKWMRSCRIDNLNEINQLFKEKPFLFRWVGPDGCGNNSNEGPLWIRPEALITNYIQGYNQAVGHTENLQPRIVKKYKQLFVLCDTAEHNYLTVIDTKTNEVEFVKLT